MGRGSFTKALLTYFSMPSNDKVQMSPASEKQPSLVAKEENLPLSSPLTCQYHAPPSNVDYNDNTSVFGKILRGEIPSITFRETESLLAFQDRKPHAPLHALIIPKKFVKSVFELREDDVALLEDMHDMAIDLVQMYYPKAAETKDYILCYHVPPFNSVDHIHLHVLAPASEMWWIFRYAKYHVGTRWCADEREIIDRLKEGKEAVPYRSPSFWW